MCSSFVESDLQSEKEESMNMERKTMPRRGSKEDKVGEEKKSKWNSGKTNEDVNIRNFTLESNLKNSYMLPSQNTPKEN